MKAIIIATGKNYDLAALNEHYPTPLIPLVNRPFIQHVIEYLVDNGITAMEFIVSYLPEKIEKFIGDGTRWGIKVNFHLCRDEETPYRKLKEVCLLLNCDERFVLAHADRLPQIKIESLTEPTMFYNECNRQWSGWALLSNLNILSLPKNADEEVLKAHLAFAEKCSTEVSPVMLSLQSYEDILASQEAVMKKQFPDLMLNGKEASDAVWLSRNVSLHPTAKLFAPVFIGDNCRIGMGAHIGPNAVIANDCVLDSKSTVANSLIFSGSYIGEALELNEAIVDKNRLINTRFGIAVSVADDFILGNLHKNHIRESLTFFFSRLTATLLLILTSPLILLIALVLKITKGQAFYQYEAIKLPAASDAKAWSKIQVYSFLPYSNGYQKNRGISDIFLRLLPGLINIAKGELHFVGVRPLPKYRVELLPHDWQSLYLNSKAGIITETFVLYGENATTDEIYSAETYYSVMSGFSYDLKLLLRYLLRITKLNHSQSNKKARLQE
ncbi:MAG: sugar transferase [Acidobacteriota bacterium]